MATRLFYLNTREEIGQAFGDWVDGMTDWEWYVTFTFRDPTDSRYPTWSQVGWKSASNALTSWHNSLCDSLGYQNPIWIGVMELQRRGVPHWHLLVANIAEQRRMTWLDWWYDHFGIARILPYDRQLGARYYLGKYLTKQQADIRFSPALYAQLQRGT